MTGTLHVPCGNSDIKLYRIVGLPSSYIYPSHLYTLPSSSCLAPQTINHFLCFIVCAGCVYFISQGRNILALDKLKQAMKMNNPKRFFRRLIKDQAQRDTRGDFASSDNANRNTQGANENFFECLHNKLKLNITNECILNWTVRGEYVYFLKRISKYICVLDYAPLRRTRVEARKYNLGLCDGRR